MPPDTVTYGDTGDAGVRHAAGQQLGERSGNIIMAPERGVSADQRKPSPPPAGQIARAL